VDGGKTEGLDFICKKISYRVKSNAVLLHCATNEGRPDRYFFLLQLAVAESMGRNG
jgi:hypothetical protein